MDRRTFNKLAGTVAVDSLVGRPHSMAEAQSGPQSKNADLDWNHYLLGTAYYPEWRQPSEWEVDFSKMQKLGINAVRMGEFAYGHNRGVTGWQLDNESGYPFQLFILEKQGVSQIPLEPLGVAVLASR